MPSTDTRIVQMQFDNRDFEKNIAVSQESLEKFKDELDFDEQEDNLRNFGDAVKNFSFDSMADNLQKLTDKFTGLGTVSELILSQIRRGIETAAAKMSSFIDSMTVQQASEGKNKFDMLNKSVQTIKAATGRSEAEVYSVMERLNKYTDQTSYNFADMAQNIGKFTSVGIPLEQAERQMEGIANWAARSGAGINEASRAMYNLSQAMGVGNLKLMDWKSIENAGMATKEFKEQLIQAGLAAGTLVEEIDKNTGQKIYKTAKSLGTQMEVNYTNLSATLSKNWATKDVLGNTLEKYYWDDLYYQGTEALIQLDEDQKKIFDKMFADNNTINAADWKTLENMGVVTDEVKEKLLELAVSNKKLTKEVKEDGTVMYKAVDKNKKEITFSIDQIEKSLSTGWFDKNLGETATSVNEFARECYEAAQKCLTFTDVIQAWRDQISTGFMNTYKHIFGELSESMELFSAICNKVGEAFTRITDALNGYDDENGKHHAGIFGSWAEMGGRESLWSMIVGEYDGMYEGALGVLDIFNAVSDTIIEGFWHMVRLLNPASLLDEAFNKQWEENEDYRQQFLAEKLMSITEGFQNFLQSVRDFFDEIPEGANESRGQMLQNVLNGLAAAIVLIYTVVKHVFGFFKSVLSKINFDPIIEMLSKLGVSITNTAHDAAHGTGLAAFFNGLLEALNPIFGPINRIIALFSELIGKVIEKGTKNGTFNKIIDFFGKLLTLFVDIISSAAGPIIDFIGDIMDAFGELFDEGVNEKSMNKFGTKLSKAIEKLINGVLEAVFGTEAGKRINEFFGYLFGFDTDAMDGEATTALGAIKMWFQKIFGVVGSIFDGFKNEEGEVTLFSLLKENLGIGSAVKFLKDINNIFAGSNIFKLLKTFGTLLTLFKAFKMLSVGSQTFDTIKGFFGGLEDSLKNGFKLDITQKTETTGEKLLKIAKAIAIIAAAVAVLGSMKLSSLIKGVAVVGLIYLMIKSLLKTMEDTQIDVKATVSLGLVTFALIGIVFGMAKLINALKPLANMRIDQVANMLTGFLGIILILGLFAKYVTKDMSNIKAADMVSVAIMAIGIGTLVKSLKPLANIQLTGLLKMAGGLAVILLLIAEFSKRMGTLDGTGMGKAVVLALSVYILVHSLLPLADVKLEGIAKMILMLGGILLMLAGFSKQFGTLKETGMSKMLILAAGIWLLLEALKPLATYNWEGISKMIVGLGAVLLMLHLFNSGLGSYRFGEMAGVIAVAASVWLLIKALMPLATVEWSGLLKIGVGLIAVLGVMYVMMEMVQGMKIREGLAAFTTMIPLALVLLAFGLTMSMMTGVSIGTIIASVIALSILLVVYFSVVDMINSNEKVLMKGMHALIAMVGLAAVMLVFSMALNEIKSMKVDKILAFSLGLAALLIAIAAALEVTSKLTLGGALKGILILGVAIAAIMAVISLLMPLIVGAIGNSLVSLSAKLSLVGNMITQFIQNMSNFTEAQIEEAKRKFAKLYDLVSSLKDASEYMQPLADFTTMIRKLGASLNLFTTLTKNIPDADKIPGLKLVERICGLKEKMTGLDLGTFGDDLALLGGAVASFVNPDGSGGIDTDQPMAFKLLQNILDSKQNIEAFSKLDLAGFTEILQGLGGALSLYAIGAKDVSGLSEEELSADGVSGAVRIMTAISESLNENGGFKIPDLPTETDLKDFPSQLAALANAVVTYANACKEFDDGKALAGIMALDFLGELNTRLTDDNIKVVDRTKDIKSNVMSRFATNIRLLGGALYSFYDSTKDFGDIENSKRALEFFRNLDKDLTADAIAATLLFKGTGVTPETLGTFSEDIVALGGALQSFATNTKFDADTSTTFDNALIALKDIIQMRNEMPDVGGLVDWFDGHKEDFSELAEDITAMGAGLANLNASLNGSVQDGNETLKFDADLVNSALGSIAAFTKIISALSYIPEDKLMNGFSYSRVLADLMDNLAFDQEITYDLTKQGREVSNVIDSVVSMMADIAFAIDYYNTKFDANINMESIDMFARFAEGLSNLVYTGSEEWNFYGVGRNIASGVKNGIMSKESDDEMIEAAKHMIKKIYDQAMASSKSASPSKLFRDTVGTYIALGIAEGINRNVNKTADAAENLVDETLYGTEGALSVLTKLLAGDYVSNPTITPVLDLSNVENGMNIMNGWFGTAGLNLNGGSLTIDPSKATIFADTAMPKDYTENISRISDEIISLRDDVRNLGTAIKNIRLVMNTGAVVGAIGPEMDRYLGQRGYYASRTDT